MKKLSALIILAMAVAMGFFIITFYTNNGIIEEREAHRPVDGRIVMNFRSYILDNNVRSDDAQALLKWCKKKIGVDVEVFVDEELIFSSIVDLSRTTASIRETYQDKKIAYPFKFYDAKADVVFYDYLSAFYNAVACEILVALMLFFTIVLFGIRRGVRYLSTINDEIHVLEGGDLTKEITVRGSDEIAMLAESINEFRKSMQNQRSEVEQLETSNRMMAAEIAHDLRTPLTSLIMYLDFAESEIQEGGSQAEAYLVKAKQKSVRLKNLIDHTFNYNIISDYSESKKQRVQALEIFSGYITDIMTYLESEGFNVRSDVSFGHSDIIVQNEAILRVFSNLVSNILKYADQDQEISIVCREKERFVEFRMENKIKVFEGGKPESTGFGSRIVKRLMKEMDGEYSAEESDGKYTATLLFLKA